VIYRAHGKSRDVDHHTGPDRRREGSEIGIEERVRDLAIEEERDRAAKELADGARLEGNRSLNLT
jgi:hypothetical protein